MINNDSIVTAYDEHLTLVEWLQKVEKLLANGGLKSTTLNDKGSATFSLTLTFNDNTTITSPDMTLTSVNEALTALNNAITDLENGTTPLFETITDSHGNKRFVEGNITMEAIEGVTQTYGKWSLSGTHLMIVVMFNVNTNVSLGSVKFANVSLPEYIYNKIQPLYNNNTVETKSFTGFTDNATATQPIRMHLQKTNNILELIKDGTTLTLNADRSFRIQFDLLIDNE